MPVYRHWLFSCQNISEQATPVQNKEKRLRRASDIPPSGQCRGVEKCVLSSKAPWHLNVHGVQIPTGKECQFPTHWSSLRRAGCRTLNEGISTLAIKEGLWVGYLSICSGSYLSIVGTNLLMAYQVTLHFFSLAYLGLHLFVFSCFSPLEAHGGKLWVLMQESQVLG